MNDFDDRTFGRTPDSMDENIVDETLGDENQGEFRDDSGMPRVSDDRDLEPQGNGVDESPWRREYSSLALRRLWQYPRMHLLHSGGGLGGPYRKTGPGKGL